MIHIIALDPSVPRSVHNWKELYTTKDPEAWFIRRASHLAFEVSDFEAAEKALRSHGVEYSRHVLPEISMKQLFFYDPEGHGIEIGVYDDTKEFFKKNDIEPPT
jgi:catechol 2,3-dioxygenase-like lactoylglutathione lyase family enzyme